MKTCSKCDIDKTLGEFYSGRADCKECVRSRQRANHVPGSRYQDSKVACQCGGMKSRYAAKCQRCARRGPSTMESPNWYEGSKGYVVAIVAGKEVRQHRWIMERYLHRPLMPHENVHHLNGVKNDNRIENLELWSTSQPSGQRVKDKIAWCKWFLNEYEGKENQEGS